MLIRNGLVFGPDRAFSRRDVALEGSRIAAIGPSLPGGCDIDAADCYVIPGLVDVHTHGALGCDFSDGRPEDLPKLSRFYAAHGTTAFLATTMTLPESELTATAAMLRDFTRPTDGARCAGIHLEGPFLSYDRRGAQKAEHLRAPDVALFQRLQAASGGQVRLITVAPETPGAPEFIRAVSPGCAVSLGHTSADYDQALAGFDAGADRITHLFNCMPSLHHRNPGPLAAGADRRCWAELICDGLHVHPGVIRMVHHLFGDRLTLISDSVRCTGMPDGRYSLGGQPTIMKDGRSTLLDGTLAGSTLTMLDAVRNVVSFGIPLEDAVYAATAAPAASVRLSDQYGVLAPGRLADLLILDRSLRLRQVILNGVPLR